MEVIAITSSTIRDNESKRYVELFELGLETLHIRKPKCSTKDISSLISEIPRQYRNRVVIHGHYKLAIKFGLKGVHMKRRHRSSSFKNNWNRLKLKFRNRNLIFTTTFHSLQSLKENSVSYDYVLLSNVFSDDSKFNFEDSGLKLIRTILDTCNMNVFAVGGIELSHLDLVKDAHFYGVGLSSTVFKASMPEVSEHLQTFLKA